MLQSVMVFPNNSDFFNAAPSMLDDNIAKMVNADQIESYMTSTSTSPVQDYIMAPSYHPQQQHQNQRQHQIQFPVATSMPPMISHSAPNSPPYPVIKTEEIQHRHSMDFLMFPQSFDLSAASSQDQHILPSQRSPQMQQQPQRMMPYTDASLIQQQQHHQQQQQQHAQQLRLQHQRALEQQHQQFHQQMMYDTPTSQSPATSISMPVTSSIMSTMVSAASSSSIFAPAAITTSSPFLHAPTVAQDNSSLTFQRHTATYTPSAHPAAPKRKREESGRQVSPQIEAIGHSSSSSASPVTVSLNAFPEESTSLVTSKKSSAAAPPTSRLSTSSRLDKVKTTRSTKVTKSSALSSTSSISNIDMITATANTPKAANTRASRKVAKKTAATSESRESSEQPENSAADSSATRLPGQAGNITHPRRAAQNRAAQRTFRNRRKAYIKELEQKVQEIDHDRGVMESIQMQNQEMWKRLQILESLAAQSGLQVPVFPPLTSFVVTGNEFGNGSNRSMMMMMGNAVSSNDDDEEDDDEMSDSFSTQQHIAQ